MTAETEAELRETVAELTEIVNRLMAPPLVIGTVTRLLDPAEKNKSKTALVVADGKIREVIVPNNMTLKRGTQVRVGPTGQIVALFAEPEPTGNIASFRRMVDNRIAEVESEGSVRTVIVTEANMKFTPNDRVIIDDSRSIIIANLGKDEERFNFDDDLDVMWDDIGGQEEAKSALREAIELPYQHPETFKHYKKNPPAGILLSGPPGCGKTLLAKAVATTLKRIHDKSGPSGMMSVKGPEILSKWVGESESTIRSIFARGRDFHARHGRPATIFIDEADAILSKRGSGISSDVNNTIVPAFLAEMDGLAKSACIVILATNRPDILDPAVIREGRVDRKIRVNRPTQDDAVEIFRIHLQGKPVASEGRNFAKKCVAELYREDRILYKIRKKSGEQVDFGMKDLVSGSMIAGVVEQSVSKAIHRDIKSGKSTGVTEEDVTHAVADVFNGIIALDHEDDVKNFTETWRDQVASVTKCKH